jgi:uncharacterized membrane protein YdjX (TVP38/TMEM64 family)
MPADDRRTPAQALDRRERQGLGKESGQVVGQTRSPFWRFAPLAVIAALIALAYGLGLHREISFETLVRNRAAIDQFIDQHGVAAVAAYIGFYVAVVSLSLPAGAIMMVIGGLLFGSVVGAIAAIVSALIGATVIFLVARSAAGEWLTRRAGPVVAKFAEGFRADAFGYVVFLRLVPFPFWLVNLAAALFEIRLSTFVAATAIGILPATVTFTVFGAGLGSVITAQQIQYNLCLVAGRTDCRVDFNFSDVFTPTLLVALGAFAVLALVPAFARRIFRRKFDASAPPKEMTNRI